MFSDFLIKCSGADKSILNQCPHSDKVKYVGIGLTIVLTSILAGLSGGYAIYFTFKNYIVSLVFSIIWGILIFNLDRFLVNSIRKEGKIFKELMMASPRILISIILSITISKPLELKLFEGSISKQMLNNSKNYTKNTESEISSKILVLNNQKKELESGYIEYKNNAFLTDILINEYQNKINIQSDKRQTLEKEISINTRIINSNTKINYDSPNKSKVYNSLAIDKIKKNNALQNNLYQIVANLKSLNDSVELRKTDVSQKFKAYENNYFKQLSLIQNELNSVITNKDVQVQKSIVDSQLDDDILGRIKALGQLKQEDSTASLASLLITILFLIIELSPILVKIITKKSGYDSILQKIEYEIIKEQSNQINIIDGKYSFNEQLQSELSKLNKELAIKREKVKLDIEDKLINQNIKYQLYDQYKVLKEKMSEDNKKEFEAIFKSIQSIALKKELITIKPPSLEGKNISLKNLIKI